MKQSIRKAVAPLALVLGIGAAATTLDAVRDPVSPLDAQAALPGAGQPSDLASAFRAASRTALPGVVFVQVETTGRTASAQVPDQLRGSPFEEFFGEPRGQQRPRMGSGSGFIVTPDGYVLTNNHVVANATRVTVTLTDKREFRAEVVGRDPNTDIAVLKIDGRDLPTVRLGDPTELQVGDWVLALGYPMSLGETVTAGIVSAKGKSIGIMGRNENASAPLEHFIQTDAVINPGNSGGPLVNLRGEVVGVNTAIASPTGSYAGYGFAVPAHLAKRVADDLIRHGAVHRPRLGLQLGDVAPADVEIFGLADASGTVVKAVTEGPAADAGIELGDVIVAVDGQPIRSTGDLMENIALRQPGERVRVDLVRYGKAESKTVRLGAFESEPAPSRGDERAAPTPTSLLGFAATEATQSVARQLRLDRPGGVVVTRVDGMGPAAQAGVRTGMVIESLNRTPVESMSDLERAAARLDRGATVSIVGRLPDGTRTIVNYKIQE